MIQARRLGHAGFETADIERSIAHYSEFAGLVVAARERGRAFLATRCGQIAIELTEAPQARCVKLSFGVAPDTDFAEAARRLSVQGISSGVRNDAAPGLARSLVFQDFKGTAIELFSGWDHCEVEDTVAGAPALKIGHLAFIVPDPAQAAKFYQEVLGFRVSDWVDDWFVFLRCSPDHHTVNFIRGDAAKMHHMAFELQDFSRIQLAAEHLGRRKVPIDWGPVRLGPGHNVAIFHRDPFDQMIELYAELDQMKDEALGCFEPRPWHRDRPQRPKVWERKDRYIWGPPPTPEFLRGRG